MIVYAEVGAGIDQDGHRGAVVASCSEADRLIVQSMYITANVQKQAHDLGVTRLGGIAQRSIVVRAGIGSLTQQGVYCVVVTIPRRGEQQIVGQVVILVGAEVMGRLPAVEGARGRGPEAAAR